MKRRFLTAEYVRACKAEGRTQVEIEPGDTLTPLAHDLAQDLGIEILSGSTAGRSGQSHGNAPFSATSNGALKAASEEADLPPAEPGPALAATANGSSQPLEVLVRQVVLACLAASGSQYTAAETPVRLIPGSSVRMQPFPFEINRPEMDVQLIDVITADHGSPMAAGFLSFHKGSFPWTLTYDEIEFVLEGEIHIGTAGGTVVGRPGDVLYVPKGTQITFGTPGWAKILYVTYPAEWTG